MSGRYMPVKTNLVKCARGLIENCTRVYILTFALPDGKKYEIENHVKLCKHGIKLKETAHYSQENIQMFKYKYVRYLCEHGPQRKSRAKIRKTRYNLVVA